MRLIISLFLLACYHALGATYYVDFASGNDASAGTSTGTAWKTIPGTRNQDDSGWQQTTWGGGTISGASKVAPGTIFKLKGGTTHDSSNGGYILIDTTYYSDTATDYGAFLFIQDNVWASGAVTFDWTGASNSIAGVVSKVDGTAFAGAESRGITFQDSARRAIQIKEKAGTSAAVNYLSFTNLYFVNNGVENTTDTLGATCGGITIRRGNHIIIDSCEFDGNQQFVNGIFLGEAHYEIQDTTVKGCISYNHKGDVVTDDSGIGLKAVNAQVLWTNCVTYSNLKGFDLGEALGESAISNVVLNCTVTSNYYGVVCNGAATAYAYDISFFLVNNLISSNYVRGANIYAGPFKAVIVHNLFANNGVVAASVSDAGHYRITPDSSGDTNEVVAHVYNNIMLNAGDMFCTMSRWYTNANVTLDSDYNSLRQGGSETYCGWGWYVTPNQNYDFGADGPGHASGEWYTEYTTTTDVPYYGTGHYHCDAHSIGTGCDDTTLPSFVDEAGGNYRLNAVMSGKNISSETWYSSYVSKDRDGQPRLSWTMGPYDYSGIPSGNSINVGSLTVDTIQ